MSLGGIIIKMIAGRAGGRDKKMLMRCLFLFYGGISFEENFPFLFFILSQISLKVGIVIIT
jgi:hypothetical protein